MMDQSKKLNQYHRLLTEELNKSNDNMMKETERKLSEYADNRLTNHVQSLNEFKNNVDKFINVFTNDIQFDLKTLEKKIVASCKTNFISKEDFLPPNGRHGEGTQDPKYFLQKQFEKFIKESVDQNVKMIYEDISYLQKNNDSKMNEQKAEISFLKQMSSENKEEINYLRNTLGAEFKNLNDCYLSIILTLICNKILIF